MSGAQRKMSDAEAMMWRLEKDPHLASTFANITILDRPPDMDLLFARMERTSVLFPRLRRRVQLSPGNIGNPTWVDDPGFDIRHHVRQMALPAPGSMRQLQDLVTLLIADPFDRSRPLWQFIVIDGLEGGRSAMVLKLHHTVTDGNGGVELSMQYLDLEREPAPLPPIDPDVLNAVTNVTEPDATDALLAAGGSGLATLGLPGTAGVPEEAVANTWVLPYNEVPTLDDDVAAVFVEPVAANMGVVAPAAGFLAGLRAECDRVGALLVFDEVITGFRLARGGAQAKFDVRADMTCFGKVIGGGLPIGAVGGRRDIMENLSPLGSVFHAGTLAGNPLATAAGPAALDELTDDLYIELLARARRLSAMLRDSFASHGIHAQFPVVGTLVGMYFGDALDRAPVNFAEAKTTDEALYARVFHALLSHGVALAPGAYEAMFVGAAHDDALLDELATRVDAALRSLSA